MLVLCNCCYYVLLVAQHVLLNVVKCDLKLLTIQMNICVHSPVSSCVEHVQCLMKKLLTFFELCNYVNTEMLQKNGQRTIHSFIWVSDVRVKGMHLARLFNSAC